MSTFETLLAQGACTTEQALALFDSLPAVSEAQMIGRWQGSGFPTGHPMDGSLELCHWHGKHFINRDEVHPLVFRRANGSLVNVNPALLPFSGKLANRKNPLTPTLGNIFQRLLWLLATRKPTARLRMVEYRGVVTAGMSYDRLPIIDLFRAVDDNTLLGVMDLRDMKTPFFFVLRRETA